MSCGACKASVCRGCKVNPLPSDKSFGLMFGAFCSEECRDGQEVMVAMSAKLCPTCEGIKRPRPRDMPSWESNCKACYDTGVAFPKAKDTVAKKAKRELVEKFPCPVCQNRWEANKTTCQTCKGSGLDPAKEEALEAMMKLHALPGLGGFGE